MYPIDTLFDDSSFFCEGIGFPKFGGELAVVAEHDYLLQTCDRDLMFDQS